MKRILIILMCCFMILSAVSCTPTNQGNGNTTNQENGNQPTGFKVEVEQSTDGTASVDKAQACEGETVTITLSANEGCRVEKLTVSYGETTTELSWSGNIATFEMPASDVIVRAEFVQETREVVDYMILGDSYTDLSSWPDFYSDMRDLPSAKTIGVGGTKVPHWGKTGTKFKNTTVAPGGLDDRVIKWDGTPVTTEVMQKYYVNNFVFHLGVNDIDAGISADTVISDLKTLFAQYREEYPNANIYWISLSLNSMYPQYIQTYKKVNAAIERYAEECEYLTYINTVDTMFPDGKTNADWFCDGLHFNADGYATWSSLITEALGYTRADVDVFGSAGNYYSSNTWEYDPETQTVSNETLGAQSEQSLWFDGVYAVDMYAEMEITVNEAKNNDRWPKFGMAVKGNGNHVFFFVEPLANLTGNNVNYTERRPKMSVNFGNNCESSVWDWTIQGNSWTAVPSLSYANGNYAKLALLRCGADMYFFVNDQLVFTKGGFVGCDGEMAIGLTLFNLDVTVKNYSVTTDVKDIIEKYGIQKIPEAPNAFDVFEGKGTEAEPYLIQSADDLIKLSELTKGSSFTDTSVYFKLTADIDVSAQNWVPICASADTGWVSVANSFNANFDGNGKTITFVGNYTGDTFAKGLFSAVGGYVHDLILRGSITTEKGLVGSLASMAMTGARIENVSSYVDIDAKDNMAGGIIGYIKADNVKITNCVNYGSITGKELVGGIVGGGYKNTSYTNCANHGDITATTKQAGGIAGERYPDATVTNCSNDGTVTAGGRTATSDTGSADNYAGYLIGYLG